MERKTLGTAQRYRIPNQTISNKTKVEDNTIYICTMKWKWAGHRARMTDDRQQMDNKNHRMATKNRNKNDPEVDRIKDGGMI